MGATPAAIARVDASSSRLASRDDKRAPVEVKTLALQQGLRTTTCPQCGLNPAGPPKKRKLHHTPRWFQLGGPCGLFLALPFLSVLAPVAYVGFRWLISSRVNALVSLCDECDQEDRRARNLRSASRWGPILFPLLALLALRFDLPIEPGWPAAALIGGALVAGVAASVAGHLRTRRQLLDAKRIDHEKTTLLAAPSFREVLRREQPEALVED